MQKDDTLGKTKRGSGGIGKGAAPKRQKEVDVFPPSLKVKIGDMVSKVMVVSTAIGGANHRFL